MAKITEYTYSDFKTNEQARKHIDADIHKFIKHIGDILEPNEAIGILQRSVTAALKGTKKHLKFWLNEMDNRNFPNCIPYDILLPKFYAIMDRNEAYTSACDLDVIPEKGKYTYAYSHPDDFHTDYSNKWFATIRETVDSVITGEDKGLISNKDYRNKVKRNTP